MEHIISFVYGKYGFGELKVIEGRTIIFRCNARTGSIQKGKLINAISPKVWTGKTLPIFTKEESMIIDGKGWKFRLFRDGEHTRYLIHPDGGVSGTLGCIGLDGLHLHLMKLLNFIIFDQRRINVTVSKI